MTVAHTSLPIATALAVSLALALPVHGALVAHYDFSTASMADRETAHGPNAAGAAGSSGEEIVFEDGTAVFSGQQQITWKAADFNKVIGRGKPWSVFISGRRSFPVGPERGAATSHILSMAHGSALDATTIEIGFYAQAYPKAVRLGVCTAQGKRVGSILSVKNERAPFAAGLSYDPRDGGTLQIYLNGSVQKFAPVGDLAETNDSGLLRLGAYFSGSGQFTGRIREFRVYDHFVPAEEFAPLCEAAVAHFAKLDAARAPDARPPEAAAPLPADGVCFAAGAPLTLCATAAGEWSARRIAYYAWRAWDVEWPVKVADDAAQLPPEGAQIRIGYALAGFDAKQLGDQGFLLRTVAPNRLLICGNTDRALFFATNHLLEKYLGFGWFWPGRLGTVIPPNAPKVLSALDVTRVPACLSRRFSGFDPVALRNGAVAALSPDLWQQEIQDDFHHAFFRLFPPGEFAATHPEYYPLINGRRAVPAPGSAGNWQPCVSNPEVVRVATEKALAFFKANPQRGSFSLSRNDSYGDCECALCRAWDGKPLPGAPFAGLGDRYYRFMNAVLDGVRKVYPDKCAGFLVYSRSGVLPQAVKPDPNLIPYFTKPEMKLDDKGMQEWLGVGFKNMGLYFWSYGRKTEIVPQMGVCRAQRDLQRFRKAIPNRMGVYAEMYPLWPVSVPKHWVLSELYWNPDENVDELLDRFSGKFYGPAGAEMLAFWKLCAARYEERSKAVAAKWGLEEDRTAWFNLDAQFGLYDEADYARMEELLAAAQVKAGAAGAFAERVRVTRAVMQYGIMAGREYALGESLASSDLAMPDRIVETASRVARIREARETYYTQQVLQEPYVREHPFGQEDTSYEGGDIRPSSYPLVGASRTFECFSRISERLGPEKGSEFWRAAAGRADLAPSVREQARVQGALLQGKPHTNLAKDPGFEGEAKAWGAGSVPSQTDYLKDPALAHGGQGCLRIREVSYSAFVGQGFAAEPGQRWRVSVWAKSNADRTGVARPFIVYWGDSLRPNMASRRAIPLYVLGSPVCELPKVSPDWQKLEMEFSVPEGVKSFDLRLQGFGMQPGEWVMYDDVEIIRIMP